jgi:hypothetical protein
MVVRSNDEIGTIFIGNDFASTMAKSMRPCLSCPMIALCFGFLATKAYANGAIIKCTQWVGNTFKNVVAMSYFHIFKSGFLNRI